jgi:heat shock protein HslJ
MFQSTSSAASARAAHLAVFALVPAAVSSLMAGQEVPASADGRLGGTSWQLVRFQGGDGAVLTPDDRGKYTLAFDATGGVTARIDCNRGRGTWTSAGRGRIQFGPLALTRAMCGPGSLHDQIARQWANVRGYTLKDGRLFLSLIADGGVYEYEPLAAPSSTHRSPLPAKGPSAWTCATAGAPAGALAVTFYATRPGLALLERGGAVKPAFQVRSASGARYEGDGVLFWEARGEATLHWMGVDATCRPS